MKWIAGILAVAVVAALVWGWDFSKQDVPIEEVRSGGPPKDGIPALMNPKYVSAAEATFLRDDDRVLGFEGHGEGTGLPPPHPFLA